MFQLVFCDHLSLNSLLTTGCDEIRITLISIFPFCTSLCTMRGVDKIKDIWWEGSSLSDLRQFPDDAKHALGFQLFRVQSGEMPDDWKPLKKLGKDVTGVYEIRVSIEKNIYRTAYVAKFGATVAVLHCWQKKTQTTAKSDLDIIVTRYRSARDELK